MDKLERLMNLTATLLTTTRPLTAEELRHQIPGYADRDDSFRRQFERDKDDLRELGLPLVVEDVPGRDPPVAGYRLDRAAYYLDDPGFDTEELAALHLALSLVRLEGGDAGAGPEGLRKLGGVVGAPDDEAGVAVVQTTTHLDAVFAAIAERRQVSFGYRGEERTVDPHRLDYQRGRWYLTAFDHGRDASRSFRLDRIEGEVRPGGPATVEPTADATMGARTPSWLLGDGPPMRAVVRVDADRAPVAVHQVGEHAVVHEEPDGAVTLELSVTNPEALRSFVLGFLDHAELLEPADARRDLIQWLEQVP